MRLMLHMVWKDVRGLSWYVGVAAAGQLGMAVVLAEAQLTRRMAGGEGLVQVVVLAGMAALALAALAAVQSDPLVGAGGDWLTRPVGWRRWVGAKLLFLALVLAPWPTVGDVVALLMAGLSPVAAWRGIVTEYLLRLGLFILPVALVGAVVQGTAKAVLAGLAGLVGVVVLGEEWGGPGMAQFATDFHWLQMAALYVLSPVAAVGVLAWQAARRRAGVAMGLGVAAALVLTALHSFAWPGSLAGVDLKQRTYNLEAGPRHRQSRPADAGVRWQRGPGGRFSAAWRPESATEFGELWLPLRVEGQRPGLELEWSAAFELEVAQAGAEKPLFKSRAQLRRAGPEGEPGLWLEAAVGQDAYRAVEGEVELRGETEFVLARAGREIQVPGTGEAAWLGEVRCSRALEIVNCVAPYRFERVLSMEPWTGGPRQYGYFRPYDMPLPATFGIGPLADMSGWFRGGVLPKGQAARVRELEEFENYRVPLRVAGVRLAEVVRAAR